jgi:hypothetical protein
LLGRLLLNSFLLLFRRACSALLYARQHFITGLPGFVIGVAAGSSIEKHVEKGAGLSAVAAAAEQGAEKIKGRPLAWLRLGGYHAKIMRQFEMLNRRFRIPQLLLQRVDLLPQCSHFKGIALHGSLVLGAHFLDADLCLGVQSGGKLVYKIL